MFLLLVGRGSGPLTGSLHAFSRRRRLRPAAGPRAGTSSAARPH